MASWTTRRSSAGTRNGRPLRRPESDTVSALSTMGMMPPSQGPLSPASEGIQVSARAEGVSASSAGWTLAKWSDSWKFSTTIVQRAATS